MTAVEGLRGSLGFSASCSSTSGSMPSAFRAAASALRARLSSRFSFTACSRARFANVCGFLAANRLLSLGGGLGRGSEGLLPTDVRQHCPDLAHGNRDLEADLANRLRLPGGRTV